MIIQNGGKSKKIGKARVDIPGTPLAWRMQI